MAKNFAYVFIVVMFILLGLASRFTNAFPDEMAVHLGDIFWASMIYYIFRVLFQRASFFNIILISLTFTFGIEFSQLYQSDWIHYLRSSFLGGLILGRGFLGIDLLRYTIGITIAAFLDLFIHVLSQYCSHNRKSF